MTRPNLEPPREPVVAPAKLTVLMAFLGLLVAGSIMGKPRMPSHRESFEGALRGVNPNTAEWWELTALPGVGEATARKIIDDRRQYGESESAFHAARDLDRIPGIGPKTIQRLASHLRFD